MAKRPVETKEMKTAAVLPPELPDNKLVAYFRRQPKPLRIAAIGVASVGVLTILTMSYMSLFSGDHHGFGHIGDGAHTLGAKSKGSSTTANKLKTSKKQLSATAKSNTNGSSLSHTTKSAPVGSTVFPASVLNLANWKLTLPISSSGSSEAYEIDQPQLANYALPPYFLVNSDKSGVIFDAPVNGATTPGSNFPRSELREMTNNGRDEASWSTTSGTSTMNVREAITHLPAVRSQLVAAQVHGPSAYVILIRLNGSDLFVEGDGGKNLGNLDANYTLGTVYNLQIVASGGHILVYYNGVEKADDPNVTTGNYFKAGCYTQSNPSYGDSSSAYGQTVIYGLSVTHA